jgi:hypothetical protein
MTFWKDMSPPSSGLKSKSSKKHKTGGKHSFLTPCFIPLPKYRLTFNGLHGGIPWKREHIISVLHYRTSSEYSELLTNQLPPTVCVTHFENNCLSVKAEVSKFNTHTKQQVEVQFYLYLLFEFLYLLYRTKKREGKNILNCWHEPFPQILSAFSPFTPG